MVETKMSEGWRTLFMAIVFVSTFPLPHSAATLCATQDRQALLEFKAGITSDKSGSLASWSSADCCSWKGVTCDVKTGRVTGLNLDNTQLSGTISSSLGNLSKLQQLDLGVNDFSGHLPESLGLLSSLTDLLVYGNQALTGPIPESFGNLSSLQTLDIRECSITGPLPQSIGGMSSLQYLYAAYNRISGPIPASVGRLSNLFTFDLEHNFLSGRIPDGFNQNLTNLFFLYLEYNNITGVPTNLRNLKNCQVVSLNNNDLSLATITGLATLPKLGELHLDSNHLSGFPSWITELKLSEQSDEVTPWIGLSNNAITGPIPAALGSVPNLVGLILDHNRLSGTIPDSLGNSIALEYLDLSVNQLSGRLPTALSKLDALTRLFNVSYNRLTGQIPQIAPFTSFGVSSYEGNPGLCGSPLPACHTRT